MEPTFTAWTKIALRLIFSLSLSFCANSVFAPPVNEEVCPSCGVMESCYCCDGAIPGCNCIAEGSSTLGTENGNCGDETNGLQSWPDAVCASSPEDAQDYCNAGYPIPINSSIPLLAIAGIFLMLVVLKVKL